MSKSAELRVLGIMSGTSVGSVDYALCGCAGQRIRLICHWEVPYPAALQSRVHAAARGDASSHEVGQLHHDLGRFYANHAKGPAGVPRPQLAGLHGQTIFHAPDPDMPATLQIGEPAWVAEKLQVPVVSNFRSGDLAAGGQGAPLATLFHIAVFARRGRYMCVQNLGGIGNVTAIDWRNETRPKVLAFDTGPANVLMDMAVRNLSGNRLKYDRNGCWAARGKVQERLVAAWLKHPFFGKPPPKSTGRELFGEPFWQRVQKAAAQAGLSRFDLVASLTEFTARSVVVNYRRHLSGTPDTVILSGGGAANPVLVAALRRNLAEWSKECAMATVEDHGWGLQTIEPAAFALLAYRRYRRLPGNLPETTGASRPVLLGQLTEP